MQAVTSLSLQQRYTEMYSKGNRKRTLNDRDVELEKVSIHFLLQQQTFFLIFLPDKSSYTPHVCHAFDLRLEFLGLVFSLGRRLKISLEVQN